VVSVWMHGEFLTGNIVAWRSCPTSAMSRSSSAT
jgi:hypothetical protein